MSSFFRVCLCILALGALSARAGAEEAEYRLGAGDQVRVTVFGQQDLSGEFTVDGGGVVSLPLIGNVPAGGATVRELSTRIADKLQPDYLRNPRVNVEVLNYRPFYIIGEVNQPGSYPYVNGMTVVNAVALAGGYSYRASESSITITRGGAEGQRFSAGPTSQVLPGDIINVPERFF
jgi:polysaccharide export outer membrane protein